MATLKDETNPGKQLTQRRALKGKGKSQSDQNLLKLVLFSVLCVFALKKDPAADKDFRVYGRISLHVKQSLLANMKISIYSVANL